ncbi:MAG: DUF3343 domain-containing protein [Thermoleophilia bacterium]
MARVVFVFATTHAAMAAEDALREEGISLQVIPLPSWVSADCGLALRLEEQDAARAECEMDRRGIRLRGVHPEPPSALLGGA